MVKVSISAFAVGVLLFSLLFSVSDSAANAHLPAARSIAGPAAVMVADPSPRPGILFSASERNLIKRLLNAVRSTDAPKSARKGDNGKSAKAKDNGGKAGLPPGLAKRDTLPPGLARQLQRNGKLPPGLDKRGLPADVEGRLPALVFGTERVIIGNDVVLLDKDTQIVLDIIRDVIDVVTTPDS
jgi:hypothetical protein